MNPRLAVVFLLVGCALAPAGCGREERRAEPYKQTIPSPDGTRLLVCTVNTDPSYPTTYLCVRFRVIVPDQREEYSVQTGASHTMRWSMHWDGNDAVVLESADIGTRRWRRAADGTWAPADEAP